MSEKINKIKILTQNIDSIIEAKIYKTKQDILLKIDLILKGGNETIGEIFKSDFTNNIDFHRSDHLYKEIKKEYRGKGYGKKMFDLWIEQGGLLPKFEYSNVPTGTLFLLKSGYELMGYFEKKGVNNDFFIINEYNKKDEVKYLKENINIERINKIYMLKKIVL